MSVSMSYKLKYIAAMKDDKSQQRQMERKNVDVAIRIK